MDSGQLGALRALCTSTNVPRAQLILFSQSEMSFCSAVDLQGASVAPRNLDQDLQAQGAEGESNKIVQDKKKTVTA